MAVFHSVLFPCVLVYRLIYSTTALSSVLLTLL